MMNILRLQDVLRKMDTTRHLVKWFMKATVTGCNIIKEYGAPISHSKAFNVTSTSSDALTLHLNSLFSSKTTGIQIMYTENGRRNKKNADTLLNTSLFSSTVSIDGENQLLSTFINLKQIKVLLEKYQSFTEATSTQTNYKIMSEVEEVTKADTDACTPKLLQGQRSCNVVSCCLDTCEPRNNGKEMSCFHTRLSGILQFMELVGNLKHTKRTGWVLRDVHDCESISGHMYRMSMMTFLLEENEALNRIRCMELALVHDLAESLVGDLTPFCGVPKEDKKAMELKAMAEICNLVKPRGKRIMELFKEYEEGESAESQFVKDLDRLDMVMQAYEYEKRDNCLMKHQEFFDSTEGKFKHPFIQKLVKEICDQRKSLLEAKLVDKGKVCLKTLTPNCPPCLEHKNERL